MKKRQIPRAYPCPVCGRYIVRAGALELDTNNISYWRSRGYREDELYTIDGVAVRGVVIADKEADDVDGYAHRRHSCGRRKWN